MEQPSSPVTNPVDLRDCIEELLKFTLQSHIKGTLDFDIGLSKQFCSNLLKDDTVSHTTGVALNPLYKRLASALYESVTCGAFCGTYNNTALFNKDNVLKQKEEWNELILDKGSELANILKIINFELHVQEPFFTQLKDGQKTIEGRCAVGDYKRIGSGASILFNKCVVLEVQEVHHYASFLEMLEAESLTKVLPGVKTIEEGRAGFSPLAKKCSSLQDVLHRREGKVQWRPCNLCCEISCAALHFYGYYIIWIELWGNSKPFGA